MVRIGRGGTNHNQPSTAISRPRQRGVPAAHAVREHRARVVWDIVDEDRAGAAFRAVAPDLGAGQSELVAQHHAERFLRHDVDAARLTVDVERDQALDRAGARRALAADRGEPEEVRRS